MKTRKTTFSIATALIVSAFVTAQSAQNGKHYTQEQINRAATKNASEKQNAVKFNEVPAGTAQSVTTVRNSNVAARPTSKMQPKIVNSTVAEKPAKVTTKAAPIQPNQEQIARLKATHRSPLVETSPDSKKQ